MRPRVRPWGRTAAPLRGREFRLLWLGGVAAEVGTQVNRLAMPLLVLALTGSPALAGAVAGVTVATTVLGSIPAGVWADRYDRRRILVLAQLMRAVAAGVLAALVATDTAWIGLVLLLAAGDGLGAAIAGPARTTALRAVVPDELLPSAYALEESRSHGARLAGAPLGGLLYELGRAVPFLAQAVALGVAVIAALAGRIPPRPPPESGPTDDPASVTTGRMRALGRDALVAARWLSRHRGLRALLVGFAALNLLGGAFFLPTVVLVGERGGGSAATAAVLTAMGAAGLLGALLAHRLSVLLPPGPLTVAFGTVFGLAVMAIALPLGPWWPVVPVALASLGTPAINVAFNVTVARLVPPDMLGRVDAVLTVGLFGLAPLGPVIGGVLAALLGGGRALLVVGAVMLLGSLLALASPLGRFTGGSTAV